jgi:hypothetical protein
MFMIVQGASGETLQPPGLLVIDTSDDPEALAQEARRLSALNKCHYRIIQLVEIAEICQPSLEVIQGGGENPIPADQYAQMREQAREQGRKAREKEKNK